MIACFLFSTIFIASGCSQKASVTPQPLPVAEKKVEVKKAPVASTPPVRKITVEDFKPDVKEAVSGFTYEEITSFRHFFLREPIR
tara:strand:+ start:215 stop:469 length:255 start_codon:yes stop_codon:yes gene_type:complete